MENHECREDIQGGVPVIRGTRIPVDVIQALLERGFTPAEVVAELPTLSEDDVRRVAHR
jgi:uncharacterized protein (DUF433 family)